MSTTRLSSKGQVIIPKQVREARGWTEGMELIVEETEAGVTLRPKRLFKSATLDEVVGCAQYKGPPKSLDGIEKELERGMRKQFKAEYKS